MMRASTGRLAILKGAALGQTKKLLVSAGYRSARRHRRLHLLQAGARRLSLGGAALDVYGLDPIGKGPMLRRRLAHRPRRSSAASCPTNVVKTIRRSASKASARRCPTRSTCW